MGFFSRRQLAPTTRRSNAEAIILNGQKYIDPIMQACAAATDHILTEVFVGSIADRLYTQRYLVAQRDKEFPGYRAEVNRLRAQHGLQPL